jgi:uncharacterized protein (DUF58 family)
MADRRLVSAVRAGLAAAAGLRIRPPSRLSRGPVGQYLGNESGTSTEFHDYRDYQPGDDPRRVDWGVYARAGSLVVRRFHVEVAPVVEVLLDTSASMGLHRGKAATTAFAAAFLTAAARHADGRAVLVLGDRRLTGESIDHALAGLELSSPDDPEVAARWPRGPGRPMRVLVSDLLFPAAMGPYVTALSRDASSLAVVQVLGAAELDPPLSGAVRLVDAERPGEHRDLHVGRAAARRYRERLAAHLGSVDEACRRAGATLIRLDVPDPPPADPGTLVVPPMLERELVEAA